MMTSSAKFRSIVAACLAVLAAAMLPRGAQALDYPDRAVHIIIPFTAGGAPDVLLRLVAQKLSEKWGQGVVVENRAVVINLKTAKALGLTVPPSLLARADEVIE